MIHVVVSKKDSLGPQGKTRIIGLEKSDLEILVKDGILEFSLPNVKFALVYVKSTREEFLTQLNALGSQLGQPEP